MSIALASIAGMDEARKAALRLVNAAAPSTQELPSAAHTNARVSEVEEASKALMGLEKEYQELLMSNPEAAAEVGRLLAAARADFNAGRFNSALATAKTASDTAAAVKTNAASQGESAEERRERAWANFNRRLEEIGLNEAQREKVTNAVNEVHARGGTKEEAVQAAKDAAAEANVPAERLAQVGSTAGDYFDSFSESPNQDNTIEQSCASPTLVEASTDEALASNAPAASGAARSSAVQIV